MKTIKLYGELGKKFGKEHKYDVKTPIEAIRALSATIPGFKEYMQSNYTYYMMFLNYDDQNVQNWLAPFSDKEVLRIVPIVTGAGSIGKIILGAALVWFAPYAVGLASTVTGAAISATIATAITSAVTSIGISLILGGVSELLFGTPKKTTYESAKNIPSYSFDGAVNTTRQGNPVPVGYGRLRVGSQVISAGIYSVDVPLGTESPTNSAPGSQDIPTPPSLIQIPTGDSNAPKIINYRCTNSNNAASCVNRTDTWVSAANYPVKTTNSVLSLLEDGRIVCFGSGNNYDTHFPTYVRYSAIYDFTTNTWSPITSYLYDLVSFGVSSLPDNTLIITGGFRYTSTYTGNTTDEILKYNPDSNTAVVIGHLPYPTRYHAQSTLLDGRIMMVGGTYYTGVGVYYLEPRIYDPTNGSFINTAPAVLTLSGTGSTTTSSGYFFNSALVDTLPDGKIIVIPQKDSSIVDKIYIYDPNTDTWEYRAVPNSSYLPNSAYTNLSKGSITVLPDGRVFYTGATFSNGTILVVYDYVNDTWGTHTVPSNNLTQFAISSMCECKLLLVGGFDSSVSTYVYGLTDSTYILE